MNSIRKFIFLLSLTSLPIIGGDLFAQKADRNIFSLSPVTFDKHENISPTATGSNMRLGYCTTEYSRGLIAKIQGQHSYHAAVFFPSELLDKYVGDKIDSMEFAIKPKRGNMAEFFICTNLKDMQGTTLARGVSLSYDEGWNKIKFDRSVTIKQGMNLYVGYILHLQDGEDYDCLLFDKSNYTLKGKNWYGYDGSWFDNTTAIGKNICIRAIISGNNIPNNDISLMKLFPADGSQFVEQNKPRRYIAYIQNNGTTPVNSLSVTVSAKGVKSTEVTLNGFDVPNNTPQRVELDNISIPVEGNYTAEFTVTKVNGVQDPYNSDNTAEDAGFSMKAGTGPVERTILFEEFTSEGYDECVIADSVYTKVLAERKDKDVVRVKHHRNYKTHNDQFRISEDTDYEELYGKAKPFIPAVCIDRLIVGGFEDPGPAYFIANDTIVGKFLNVAKGVYSFINLNVEPKVTGNKLNVKVSGHAGTNEMPQQTDLRLVTWLVEDGIVSSQQTGKPRFIQNGVLRKVLSSNAWGDALNISAYDFEKTYSVDLKPEWKANNMRVVSFVSNYNADVEKRIVYNTAQALCGIPDGIAHSSADDNQSLYIVDGNIIVADGYKLAGIYDLSGRIVSADRLTRGIYVVKVTNGKTTFTRKVCINK